MRRCENKDNPHFSCAPFHDMMEKNRKKPGEPMKPVSQKAIRALALLLALVAGLGYAVVNTYEAYTQMVVEQRQ